MSAVATYKLLTGRAFSEEKLIALACAFEAATEVRKRGPVPYIVSHINAVGDESVAILKGSGSHSCRRRT